MSEEIGMNDILIFLLIRLQIFFFFFREFQMGEMFSLKLILNTRKNDKNVCIEGSDLCKIFSLVAPTSKMWKKMYGAEYLPEISRNLLTQ